MITVFIVSILFFLILIVLLNSRWRDFLRQHLSDFMFAISFLTFFTWTGRETVLTFGSLDWAAYSKILIRIVTGLYFLSLFLNNKANLTALRCIRRKTWPFTIYCAFATLSLLWTETKLFSFYRVFELLVITFSAIIYFSQKNIKDTLLPLYIGSGTLVVITWGVYMLMPSVVVNPEIPEAYRRFGGSFVGPILLAEMCGILLIGLFSELFYSNKLSRKKIFIIINLMAIAAISVVLTKSRAALSSTVFSLGLMFLFYLIHEKELFKIVKWIYICTICIVIISSFYLQIQEWFQRGEDISSMYSLNSRIDIWAEAITQNPLLIAGKGFASQASEGIFIATLGRATKTGHNAFVDAYLSLGIIGVLLLLISIALYCWYIARVRVIDKSSKKMKASLIGVGSFVIISGFTETGIGGFVNPILIAFIFSFCLASIYSTKLQHPFSVPAKRDCGYRR